MLRDLLIRIANAARWIVGVIVVMLAAVQATILGLVPLDIRYTTCVSPVTGPIMRDGGGSVVYSCVASRSLYTWQLPVALLIAVVGMALALVVAFWRRPRPRPRQFRRVPAQWR